MSFHRQCCTCCGGGDWIYAQPCTGSDAFSHYDVEKEVNVSHWELGCQPRLSCEYVREITNYGSEESTIVVFALLGACWFVDGSEPIHQACQGDNCPQALGFYLPNLEPDNPDIAEEIYETCSDCLADEQNEKWYRFKPCECGLKQPNDPCQFFTSSGGDETYVYIPVRYIDEMNDTFCVDSGGSGQPWKKYECAGPLNVCIYWMEPRTIALFGAGCCMKSCTENNEEDIVDHIPCEGRCHCCDIWTPFHFHPLNNDDGEGVNCDISINRTIAEAEWGAIYRGCCICCNGETSIQGTDYCRMFDGMSTFSMTFVIDETQVSGFDSDLYGCYPCKTGVQIITLNFSLHPEVADTGIWIYDDVWYLEHCMFFIGAESQDCTRWDGSPSARSCIPHDGITTCANMPPFTGHNCIPIAQTSSSWCDERCEDDHPDPCSPGVAPCCGDSDGWCDNNNVIIYKECTTYAPGGAFSSGYGFIWTFVPGVCVNPMSGSVVAGLIRIWVGPVNYPCVRCQCCADHSSCINNTGSTCAGTSCDASARVLEVPPERFCFLFPDETEGESGICSN